MKKVLFKNVCRVSLATAAFIVGLGMKADAQTYPYVVDFEGDPAPSKAYASADPVDLNGINWVMPGVYLGNMQTPPGDKFNDGHAARMRLSENTTGDPGYMQMDADLPNGIGTVTFQAAMYGTETGGLLGVYYSTNGGTTWTQSGTDFTLTDALTTYTATINQSGNVRIKFMKEETTNARINIDDISMTQFGTATSLTVSSKSPTGSNVPLTTTDLSVTFSANIVAGSGNITLLKTGGSPVTFPVSGAAIAGMTATVSGISLENASEYTVTIPANAFTNTGATLSNQAITWTFSTEDTSTPVITIPTYTALNETFPSCGDTFDLFTNYSFSGVKKWACIDTSHLDPDNGNCVYINGGSAAGVSEANEDWLISVGKFDFSAMTHPELSLWQFSKFSGDATRKVKISTDYSGIGDPTTATWDSVYTFNGSPATSWEQVGGIDLTEHKGTPFFLAFTYECGTTGTYALYYDEIKVDEHTTGLYNVSKSNLGIMVLGAAQRNNIVLGIDINTATQANIAIYDMQGRRVYNADNNSLHAGHNTVNINNIDLNAGMYVIRVNNGKDFGAVKAMIK